MRYPPPTPQLFHQAVSDFINALDVSVDRLAPFAGLQPQQLRRLGQDGKHHTLAPATIDNLVMAPVLVGRPVAPEVKDAWERHLKVASFYTVLIATAHRRTHSTWPQTQADYQVMWQTARDLVLYSKYTVYYVQSDTAPQQNLGGFLDDPAAFYEHWRDNRVETEDDIVSALAEIDQGRANKKG